MDDTYLLLNVLEFMPKEKTSVVFTEKYTDNYAIEAGIENLELNVQKIKQNKQ
jgi:hypothetical protein